jgi:hypothetical protein
MKMEVVAALTKLSSRPQNIMHKLREVCELSFASCEDSSPDKEQFLTRHISYADMLTVSFQRVKSKLNMFNRTAVLLTDDRLPISRCEMSLTYFFS